MKPLTKREKILLYALAVIAIVAGIVVLLIQPAMEKSETLDETILERQMGLDGIRASLMTQQALLDEVEANEAAIEEERKFFLPVMTNNELDEYITGLLQTHGLTALSLVIAADAEQSPESDVQQYAVRTTARGTMAQFMLLTDTVNELDGIRITAISNRQDAMAATPPPTPTPRPGRKTKATPAPLFTTPAPTPQPGTYTMDITFAVLEYADGTSTSVTLDRED